MRPSRSSTIRQPFLNNTNGRYPQGFQTPGIVRMWQQANGGAINGQGSWQDTTSNAQQSACGSRTTGASSRH
jgi:hypothetical protein